jgi:tetratricopeptide (TPR) repeat protein
MNRIIDRGGDQPCLQAGTIRTCARICATEPDNAVVRPRVDMTARETSPVGFPATPKGSIVGSNCMPFNRRSWPRNAAKSVVLLLIIAVAIGFRWQMTSNTRTFERYLADATTALHAAQAAVNPYPAALRVHPAQAVANTLMYYNPRIIAELKGAERLKPNDAGVYLLGAQYCVLQNDPDQAEQQARQCVRLDPNCAEGWYVLGCALNSRPSPDRLAESIADFRHAAQLNGADYSTWLALGNALVLAGQNTEAISCLERAQVIAATAPAAPVPGGPADAVELLQDRMRISLALDRCYHRAGNASKETMQRRDSDRLAGELLVQSHQIGRLEGG